MSSRPYKQVLLYRRDLKMRKGKMRPSAPTPARGVLLRPALRASPVGTDPLPAALWRGDGAVAPVRPGQDRAVGRGRGGLDGLGLALEAGLPTIVITDAPHGVQGGADAHGLLQSGRRPSRPSIASPARTARSRRSSPDLRYAGGDAGPARPAPRCRVRPGARGRVRTPPSGRCRCGWPWTTAASSASARRPWRCGARRGRARGLSG